MSVSRHYVEGLSFGVANANAHGTSIHFPKVHSGLALDKKCRVKPSTLNEVRCRAGSAHINARVLPFYEDKLPLTLINCYVYRQCGASPGRDDD